MHRLRRSSFIPSFSRPHLKKKALDSWSAVQDTYFSTKDIFERHKVVFTISTSLASVATAWIGYSLRYLHEVKVEQRLNSIEATLKSKHEIENDEIKKIANRGNSSIGACLATGGASLITGYVLGWRGGSWYANRKLRREQMRFLGQAKPKRWPRFHFLGRTLRKHKMADKDLSNLQNSSEPNQFC